MTRTLHNSIITCTVEELSEVVPYGLCAASLPNTETPARPGMPSCLARPGIYLHPGSPSMTDYAEKYAEALDPGILQFFRRCTYTENANTALWGWVPTKELPDEHHLWLAAVMFRSHNGDSTLKAALALADDTGHLAWNPHAMSDRSAQVKALMRSWDGAEKIRCTDQARDQVIYKMLPFFGVDPDTVDIGLARDLFETTVPSDEYGRSGRIRRLLIRLHAAGTVPGSIPGGDGR